MQKQSTVVGIFDDYTAAVDAIKELRQSGFSDDQLGFVVRHDAGSIAETPGEEPNAVTRGVVGGLLGAADALLLPVTGPGDASTMLGAALPATEEAIDTIGRPEPEKEQSSTSSSTEVPEQSTSETAAQEEKATADESDSTAERNTSIITGSVIGGTLGAVAAMLIPGIGPILAGGLLAATFGGAAIGGIAGGFLSMGVPEHRARHYEQQFQAGRIILTIKAGNRQQQALDVLCHYGAHEVEAH